MFDDEVERICEVDPVTGHVNQSYQLYIIYPANGYATSMDIINHAKRHNSKKNWMKDWLILMSRINH